MSSTQQRPAAQTRERLIESHLPLVKALARRYAGPEAELEDLVQVGAVGLIKASDRFDPDKGVSFATYATPTIEGEIRHHLRDRGSAMRIPRQLQRLGGKIHRCQGELAVKLGRSPTAAEVATALNISEAEVDRALAAERARDSVPLTTEGDAAGAVAEPSSGSDNRLTLASSMRTLDDRERRIVYLRFHADKTERQIAREMAISQAHVSRLLSGALSKLREGLQDAGDTTSDRVISPDSEAQMERKQPQTQEKRQTGVSRKRGRPQPVEDGELQAAIERWLASERGAGTAPDDRTSDAAKRSERKPGSTHSGRFLVRMPSTLHEQLAQAAEREQVSLNRYVTDALATTVTPDPDPDAQPQPTPEAEPAADDGRTPPSARTIRMVLAANLAIVVVSIAVAAVLLVLALQRAL